ncbi:MAG TPA: LysR substrate-binding domain-containing protein [Acidimicrobiales bacterium]|jgi:DNA-binding transcriptional LysR family regulator|nr:LysR substrate-binding domain-containing protein [Acidimicrobiales bacterium]
MRPQLHQLEYFVAVAEDRHFTRAAERLHVAQPSVSAQIRQLERTLGTQLFHRAPGKVSLTDAGELLLPLARRALADVEELVDGVADLDSLQRGRVAIGATPSLSTTLLPAALSRFHQRHPGVALAVTEQGSRRLVDGLESGELDVALAILPLHQPLLDSVTLAIEELVVVTSADHPLAARRRIEIADLSQVPLVMFRDGYDLKTVTLSVCHQAGFEPVVALEGGEMDGVLALVGAGLGAAIVPSIVASAHPDLHRLRVRSLSFRREIGLVHRGDRPLSRAAAALSAEITGLLAGRGWPSRPPPGLQLTV